MGLSQLIGHGQGRNTLSGSSCTLCSYVCIGQPGPGYPPKVGGILSGQGKPHCLFPSSGQEQREGISLWAGCAGPGRVQYIPPSQSQDKSFETEYFCQLHTYEQRERHSYISSGGGMQSNCVITHVINFHLCFYFYSCREKHTEKQFKYMKFNNMGWLRLNLAEAEPDTPVFYQKLNSKWHICVSKRDFDSFFLIYFYIIGLQRFPNLNLKRTKLILNMLQESLCNFIWLDEDWTVVPFIL